MARRLIEEAQADSDAFELSYGNGSCSCHLNPPCGYCIHPGNPSNLAECDECWEEVPDDEEDTQTPSEQS